MKRKEYKKHLHAQGICNHEIEECAGAIEDFEAYLTGLGFAEPSDNGKEEVYGYAGKLISEGVNTLQNFSILRDYTLWLGSRAQHVALIEIMDCHGAYQKLETEIEKRHGLEISSRIFRESPPPLGAGENDRCAYTRKVTDRMSRFLSPQQTREAWFHVKHGIPDDYWLKLDIKEREKYLQCGGIDAFLNQKRRERDDMLTRLRDQGKLWYTIEITDEVLDYIVNNPEMEVGKRYENKIMITKVPYHAARYLHETDGRLKRYYACHCPLAREAILTNKPASPDICNCSLGHASHYLSGLGLKLKGEVLESAIQGDARCRFVFYLPDW